MNSSSVSFQGFWFWNIFVIDAKSQFTLNAQILIIMEQCPLEDQITASSSTTPLDSNNRELDEWLDLVMPIEGGSCAEFETPSDISGGGGLDPPEEGVEECIEDDSPPQPHPQIHLAPPVYKQDQLPLGLPLDPDDDHLDDITSCMIGDYRSVTKADLLSRCIVTFFPKDNDRRWLKPETYFGPNPDNFQCWCGQFEICPRTGALHAHIYFECVRSRRLRFVRTAALFRKYHHRVHIKKARTVSKKQRQSAINYVLDDAKRAPGETIFTWHGCKFPVAYDDGCKHGRSKKTITQSKEENTEEQRLWIESKPRSWTWDQIVHESDHSKKLLCTCSWGQKYHAGRRASDPRRTISNVIILYGAGGTGKTTTAHDWDPREGETQKERYYRRNPDDGHFWGAGRSAYNGQRIVHFEEFTGQEAFSRLKEVCDIGKSGPTINIKNSGGELNHETVIFTSNVHPAGWFHKLWKDDPKQFHPFWRRVTEVRFYPTHRADGALNIPDQDHPPAFIDQTGEWREFGGDYQKALAHADTYWPLKMDSLEPQSMLFNPGGVSNYSEPPFFSYCKTGRDPTNIWGR
ncbi:putative replication-associated protein [Protobacilladnavirus chasesal]|uniref:Replication-associated protein n=1 Tax=Protobacilladnavirus chasesal TaxID=3052703 RepID=Q2L6L8_9VIRU|nr:putative replication-associated protein [Protobacilladnavirus chasesal]BAE79193.1 putative replication-associated protein [Protobacilladnavirus chasesal]